MIPVHADALINVDIAAEKDEKYRRLLERQASLCNRLKADILNHAQMTYFDVVSGKNKFLVGISCDFKKLERACKSYKKILSHHVNTSIDNLSSIVVNATIGGFLFYIFFRYNISN